MKKGTTLREILLEGKDVGESQSGNRLEGFLDRNFLASFEENMKELLKEGFSIIEILEFFRNKIQHVREISSTGTGASATPGSGEQYTGKKFKKDQD